MSSFKCLGRRNRVIEMVISGGQTGVDRGALDGAIALGIKHGGFCPKGRKAEDGRIPARYKLTEADSSDYAVRTRLNVELADVTLVLTLWDQTPGTKLTQKIIDQLDKPALIRLWEDDLNRLEEVAKSLRNFIEKNPTFKVLNVAGPRESRAPGIQDWTRRLIIRALGE